MGNDESWRHEAIKNHERRPIRTGGNRAPDKKLADLIGQFFIRRLVRLLPAWFHPRA